MFMLCSGACSRPLITIIINNVWTRSFLRRPHLEVLLEPFFSTSFFLDLFQQFTQRKTFLIFWNFIEEIRSNCQICWIDVFRSGIQVKCVKSSPMYSLFWHTDPFRRIFLQILIYLCDWYDMYGFPQIQDFPASSGIMQVSFDPAIWRFYLNINPSIYTFSISLIDNGSWQAIRVCWVISKWLFLSASLLCRNPVSNTQREQT